MFADIKKRVEKRGKAPGTAEYTGSDNSKKLRATISTFDAVECNVVSGNDISTLLLQEKPAKTTWIDVVGLSNVAQIKLLSEKFNIHPLTVEDILNVTQRPKVEEFENYLFITLKTLNWNEKKSVFAIEQVSIVLGENFILSFQESDDSISEAILKKLQTTGNQRLRQQGADYLAYRLIDSIVDEYFNVLEGLGEQIEKIEERIIASPSSHNAKTIYHLKRQILILRKAIWPMREAINHLLYAEDGLITKFTRIYLRDVYDHTMQAIDTIETFRDMLSSMLDMYLSGLTIRMNEIMKTLTIITTIFIPITALASIYGMNMPGIPLMKSNWGFPVVAALMIFSVVFMILYFRRKKWI